MSGKSESSQRATGRRVVAAIIVATLALSASVIITFLLVRGPERIGQQAVRFGLTVLISVHLYRGAPWARWVAVVLYFLGGLVGLSGLLGLEQFNVFAVIGLVLSAVYLVSSVCLAALPSVRAHFGGRVSRSVCEPSSRIPGSRDTRLSGGADVTQPDSADDDASRRS